MEIVKHYCIYCRGELKRTDIFFSSHFNCENAFNYLDARPYTYFQNYWVDFVHKKFEDWKKSYTFIEEFFDPYMKKLKIKYKEIFDCSKNSTYIKHIGDFLINNTVTESFFMEEFAHYDPHWLNIILFIYKLYNQKFNNPLIESFLSVSIDRNNSGDLEDYLICYEYYYPKLRELMNQNYSDELLKQGNEKIRKKKSKRLTTKEKNLIMFLNLQLEKLELEREKYERMGNSYMKYIHSPYHEVPGLEFELSDEEEYFYLKRFIFLFELYQKKPFHPLLEYIIQNAKEKAHYDYKEILNRVYLGIEEYKKNLKFL